MADITKTVREMKVLALRTELKNRGLSPSGLKSSLVRRLLKALKAEGYEVQDLGEEEEVVGVDHGEEETASHVGKWRRYMISKRFRGVRHATVRSIHVAERKEIWLVGDTTDSIVSYAQEPAIQTHLETSGTRIPTNLKGFSATRMGDIIVVFGGSVETPVPTTFNDVFVLLPDSRKWVKVTCQGTPPRPRDSHAATEISRNLLLVHGGKAIGFDKEIVYGDAFVLDIDTWTWTQVPIDQSYVPRYGHTATLHPDSRSVYVFGGCFSEGGVSPVQFWMNELLVFNVESMTWSKPDSIGQKQQPRAFHTADLIKNKLFIFGGCNKSYGSWQYPNYVDFLDIDCLKWKRLPTVDKVPMGRYGHLSCSVGHEILVLGGCRVPSTRPPAAAFYVLNTEYKPSIVLDNTTFEADMRVLWASELFSDINFRVQNKYVRAHKGVIASRSESLKEVCNKKKKRGMTVTIESAKHTPFALLIELLYTGRVKVDAGAPYDQLIELLQLYRLRFKDRKAYHSDNHIITIPDISLKSACNQKLFDDVTFKVGIQKGTFVAHKAILCARSPYFTELFSGEQTSDDSQAESPSIPLMLAPPSPGDLREPIHIPNVSPENFKILLDFIYDGFGAVTNIQSIVAKGNPQQLVELLNLSHFYRVFDLKQHCERALFDYYLTEETAVALYEVACQAEAIQLKHTSMYLVADMIASNKLNPSMMGGGLHAMHQQELLETIKYHQTLQLVGSGGYLTRDDTDPTISSFDESVEDMSISESEESSER